MKITVLETKIETITKYGRKGPQLHRLRLSYETAFRTLVNKKQPHELLKKMIELSV